MSEPRRDEHESCVAVGERADDASAPSHLANDALERIAGADASPMLGRTQGVTASERRTGWRQNHWPDDACAVGQDFSAAHQGISRPRQ